MAEDDLKFADTLSNVDAKIKQSSMNKTIYLVQVFGENQNEKKGHKTSDYFYTTNINMTSSVLLEFKGYSASQLKTDIKTVTELNKCVQENKLEEISIYVPWHQVIRITNTSFKR